VGLVGHYGFEIFSRLDFVLVSLLICYSLEHNTIPCSIYFIYLVHGFFLSCLLLQTSIDRFGFLLYLFKVFLSYCLS
jgi:hypothetical protein